MMKRFWQGWEIHKKWVCVTVALFALVVGTSQLIAQRRVNRLIIGGGSQITRVLSGSVSWDPASVATIVAAENATAIVATGASIGDFVIVTPSAAWGVAIVMGSCRVSALNAITCTFSNPTAGALDPAAQVVEWVAIRTRD